MKEVIDAIIDMLHRKGIVTDEEKKRYDVASLLDYGTGGIPTRVISAIDRMGEKQ